MYRDITNYLFNRIFIHKVNMNLLINIEDVTIIIQVWVVLILVNQNFYILL